MKKFILTMFLVVLSLPAFAVLTVNNIPRTKTGSTTPTLQDSHVTDNGNIGVNSTSPNASLNVVGLADQTQLTVQGFSTQTTNPFVVQNSAGTAQFSVTNAGNVTAAGTIASGGTGQSAVGYGLVGNSTQSTSANNGDWTIKSNADANSFWVNATSGNVGVGTFNPQKKLAVTGSIGFSGDLVGIGTTSVHAAIQSSANQACNTTCTSGPCAVGLNTGGTLVDCADATADSCLCLDGNGG